MTGIRRIKCPLCGGEIIVSALHQVSHDFRLTKSGRLSKKYTTSCSGTEEVIIAGCSCGANWNCVDFEITPEGYFVDYKYDEEN